MVINTKADDIYVETAVKKIEELDAEVAATKYSTVDMMYASPLVWEYIAKEEAERREKEEAELALESKATILDMSEDARRLRAHTWYSRMGMPSRKIMKERVDMMPFSVCVSVEDVDLLIWNYNCEMVNVGKMQKFINAGFKKSPRKEKKVVAADSGSASG
jgi:hypothetical protein